MFGAQGTTASFITSALYQLLRSPSSMALFRACSSDASKRAHLLKELLRLEPPVHRVARATKETVRLGDMWITPGSRVLVLLASANRDPQAFEAPDELRVGRPGPPPLSFGHGDHRCIGERIALEVTGVVLTRLLARHPGLRLANALVEWSSSPTFRSLLALDVAFPADGEDGVLLAREAGAV
jgi:cytochrome P450